MATLATLGSTSVLRFHKPKPEPQNIRSSLQLLGYVTSQLSGIKISYNLPDTHILTFHSFSAACCSGVQAPSGLHVAPPLYSGRVCPLTAKKANKANQVSFSNHKTKKLQFVNLQYKKVWWEAGNRYVKLRQPRH